MPRVGLTKDVQCEEKISFKDMYLSPHILQGLHDAGYINPSPIQLKCIPLGKVK